MGDISHYPECLRRGDAGGQVQTRTQQSEMRYRKRYVGMARTLSRQLGVDMVTPADMAADLGHRASRLKASALKQYSACIRQHLRDLWDEEAISLAEVERIDAILRKQHPMARGTKGKAGRRTSAGRAKSVNPARLTALVGELLSRPTAIRRIAARPT